jgi:hypothetical protein
MLLFSHPTGPLIRYIGDTLTIEDMNPEKKIIWNMSRGEMLKLGLRCILAAFWGIRKQSPQS